MSEPNGGGGGGGEVPSGRPDGLARGAASSSSADDATLMPPPPPRLKNPPQASLNPLLVGATVVSASGPPQRLNVRCRVGEHGVGERGRKREKERELRLTKQSKRRKKNPTKKKKQTNRATQPRHRPRLLFRHRSNRPRCRLWPSADDEARSPSRRGIPRSSGFEGPGSGKVG